MAGVTIVQVAVARRGGARRARGAEAGDAAAVGVYAGMAPAELAAVLRLALQLPPSASFSAFAVSEVVARGGGGKKPRRRAQANGELQNGVGGVRRRIVPLSLACRSPELLRGSDGRGVAELIVTTEAADAQEGELAAAQGVKTEAVPSSGSPSAGTAAAGGSAKASERIARLVSALQQERAVSEFEGAVLAEMCEQKADEVLAVVGSSRRSLDAKKQYLLDLVKPSPAVDSSPALDASRQHPNSRPASQRFGGEPQNDAHQQVPSRPEDLHVELVFKKVMAIARSVFSPQTQSELTGLAKSYRTKSTQPRSRPLDDARFTRVMELLAIVEKLLNKHALPEEQSFYLIELVLAENRMLLSALQAFKQDGGSWSELETTVTRVAALNTTERVDASTLTSPRNGSPRKRTKNAGKSVASPRHSKRDHAHHHISSPPGPKPLPAPKVNGNSVASKGNSVMFTLHTKRMLTSLEYDILCALVQQDDSQVLELLADYDQQQITLLALRDALVGIVDEITTELGDEEKAAFAQGMSDAALDGQYGTGSAPQWPLQIAHMLAKWQQSGVLSAEHAHVLEQMTVQRHHLLESAYEVFAGDGDESELLDTLQRVAKLQATVQQMEAQEQFEQQKQFNAVVDTQCDALGASDKLLVKQLFSRRSELVIAAWQVYEAEHNADELADTLLRIARFTTRNDTKLRLVEIVGEMMKRRLIRSHEADGLIRLFEERNEALMAANEAFEADGDVKELVETLLLVVKHANFGDPPVCSPRGSGDKSFSFDDSAAQNAESLRLSKIIDQITSKGRLAAWQKAVLLSLLEAGDVRLLAAYDLYNDDRNVRELVDTLQRLADIVAWERGKQQLIDEWVAPLAASGRISSASGDLLRVLVEKRDDRVMAAFSVYLEDQNGSELSDSLARIAAIAFLQKITRQKESEQVESSNMLDVVSSLIENGALESESKGTINALIEAKDPRVLAAMDVYATTSDAADLADTLRRIIAIDSRVAAGRSPSVRMEKQLLHFVSELPLDAEQAAVLKRAIAERDAEIEAAARTFLEKSDESGLKDTLLRLATRVSSTPETVGDA